MTAFFAIFSFVCSTLLVASVGLGYFSDALGLNASHHLLLGLGAAILSISLHCLVFGIFTGSGKDTRELCQDLNLSPEFAAQTKAFRRVVFPPALYAILLLVVGSILGGALSARPASTTLHWVHGLFMWFTVLYNIKAFVIEYKAVRDNARILKHVNSVANSVVKPVAPVRPGEPEILATAKENLEWGTHVYALGKFLCFLGWNMWLPYIYLRFIVGYFRMPVWPFVLAWLALLGAGYYLRGRYQTYRPSPHHPARA